MVCSCLFVVWQWIWPESECVIRLIAGSRICFGRMYRKIRGLSQAIGYAGVL